MAIRRLFPAARRFASLTSPAMSVKPPAMEACPAADELCRLLLSHYNPFHPLESPLQLSGVSLSGHLLVQTLLRLRGASKVALSLLVWARNCPDLPIPPTSAYDVVIDSLGRARQFDAAWRLIVEMGGDNDEPKVRLGPTSTTFGILMRRYVAAGMTRQAIRAFDDMEAFIDREAVAEEFALLLDTLCKYKYPKVATEIFNKRKYKYEPNEKMYTIMIYGWCKVNRNDMAQKFLQEMIDRGIHPNIVTYNILLNGICRHTRLHPEIYFDRTVHAAESLQKEMRARGIEPDVTSYSILLHVYSRAHKPELCLCMFRSMKEKGICPTIATYTSLIKCLASCGRLEDAEYVLSEMECEGVCPSPATYNCFFKEYHGRKDLKGALALYNKMRQPSSPSSPDIHTYKILLRMFVNMDRFGTVYELWKDMVESNIGPDLDAYTLLIHGLCGKQKWKEACQYFMKMIEKGFLPQKITVDTLYKGLIQNDMLQTWWRLKKRVQEEAVKFSSEFKPFHFDPYKR